MSEILSYLLTAVIPSVITWLFARPKDKVEIKSTEIDNAIKNAGYYQNLLDDYAKRLSQALDDLDAATAVIRERDSRIQELMDAVEDLTDELKKYKQLNGKSK